MSMRTWLPWRVALLPGAVAALVAVTLVACAGAVAPAPGPQLQRPGTTSPGGLFPTGVDGSGNALAPGTVDPHYTLTSTDPSFRGPISLAVKPAGPRWIHPPNASSMWDSIQPAGHGAAGPVYTYTTTFTLEGIDPARATITGLVACDDECTVLLNGTQVASIQVPAWEATHPLSIPAGSPFRTGTNTLAFAVHNLGGVTGLGVFAIQVN